MGIGTNLDPSNFRFINIGSDINYKSIIRLKMELELKCPECGGRKIEVMSYPPKLNKPETKEMTMDDWVDDRNYNTMTLEYNYTKEVATCQSCGYKRERFI